VQVPQQIASETVGLFVASAGFQTLPSCH